MQLDVAKLPKTFYKNIDKKVQTQKNNNNKELSSVKDRNVNNKSLLRWKKKFVTCQIQCRRYGGLALYFGLLKILFLQHHATIRKPTMMQKGLITFNPTYLTKVTYISSFLKFLNSESLEYQV